MPFVIVLMRGDGTVNSVVGPFPNERRAERLVEHMAHSSKFAMLDGTVEEITDPDDIDLGNEGD